jgi:WD40 repeat protein
MSNNADQCDTTDSQASIDAFEQRARRAGAALRRPAPHDGIVALRSARRRQQLVRGALAGGAVIAVIAVAAVVLSGRDPDRMLAPAVPNPTLPTSAPEPVPSPTSMTPTTTGPAISPTTAAVTTQAATKTPTSGSVAESTAQPAPGTFVVTSNGTIHYPEPYGSFGFNADGSRLGLTGPGYGLRVYDPSTLTMERELECPTTAIEAADPDITSFTWDPQVAATWDTDSKALLTDVSWNPGQIGCEVVFSPDGSLAARSETSGWAKYQDLSTLLWDTTDGKLIAVLDGISPRFSLDGTRLVTASDGVTKVWEAATARPVEEFDGSSATPTLSGDRTRVWLAGNFSGLVLDARTFDRVADTPWSSGARAINHDGTLVAVEGGDNTLSVWDVATNTEVHRLEVGLSGYAIGTLVFSSDGTYLAASNGVAARVWDVSTGKPVFTLDDSDGPITVAFSPDGSQLAIPTIGHEPQFFDASTGEQLNHPGSTRSGGHIVFSPDGRTLAEGRIAIYLWTYVRA